MILSLQITYQNSREDSLDIKITRTFQNEAEAMELAKSFATRPGLYTVLVQNRQTGEYVREIISISENGSLNETPIINSRRTKDERVRQSGH